VPASVPVRVAVIGSSALSHLEGLRDVAANAMDTPYGPPSSPVVVGRLGSVRVAFLARHGETRSVPPHRVNHRANLWALKEVGVQRILATSSVGSLKKAIRPGTLAIPHDYISLWEIPTFHDDKPVHATPALDQGIRTAVLSAAKRMGARVRSRAVYAQTLGPRLETKAEIRLLADYADLVGMTMASEATLAAELGLAYASLCTVDNYAHGITPTPLTFDAIRKKQEENAHAVARLLEPTLRILVAEE